MRTETTDMMQARGATRAIAKIGAVVALMAAGSAAHAADGAAGLWTTVDDETGKPRSQVRITEAGGVLSARVEKILTPGREGAVCDRCEGDRKDKPILGMLIIEGLTPDGDGAWSGGRILDPVKGKFYKVKMHLEDKGSKLELRGYVGVPLFGRSQTWYRAEE